MNKYICQKLASIALCFVVSLTAVPMAGYGTEFSGEEAVTKEEPSAKEWPQESTQQPDDTEMSFVEEAATEKTAQIKQEDPFQDLPFYEDEEGNRHYVYTDSDYSFFIKDGKTAILKKYNGAEKNVIVPETLTAGGRTYTVKIIGSFAFSRWTFESITLPETVEKLEDNAFSCGDTGHIYLPKSITSIEGEQTAALFLCWKDSYAYQYLKRADTQKKMVKYKTGKSQNDSNGWHTRVPFKAGNCSSVIVDGVLVSHYARKMYNSHQCCDVIAVDTEKMTKNSDYSTFTGHSFDLHIIALQYGGVCYADQGDGYPRGFHITFSNTDLYAEQTPFHFYGELGENTTDAWLGVICETEVGIMLSGASRKSSKAGSEGKNLFVQLVDEKRKIAGSKSRKGTCCGDSCTDKGVKWLTNYTSAYDVANPKLVKMDDGRMVVLWEKFKNGVFVRSYYMVLAGDGTTIQNANPMNKVRLASFEEPLCKNGKIYWVTAGSIQQKMKDGRFVGYGVVDGKKAVVNCLEVGKLVKK